MSRSDESRTVVLSFDTLGDLTLRQPFLAALLDAGSAVTVALRPEFAPLVRFLDARLEVLAADIDPNQPPDETTAARAWELRERILARRPTRVVSPLWNRTFVDEWLLRQLPDQERIGFDSPSPWSTYMLRMLPPPLVEPALTRAVEIAGEAHELEKNSALAEALCGPGSAPQEPALTLGEEVRREAQPILEAMGLVPGRYAIGCLGGRTSLKLWPVDSYAATLAELSKRHGLASLVVGVQREEGLLASVKEAAASRGVSVSTWVGGPSEMGRLLALIADGRLYVGGDTGPMHLAGALGVPVLARFGGGHWPRFLPRARRSFVATQRLPCFGCEWLCRIGRPVCVTGVTDAVLLQGLEWILSGEPDARRVDDGVELHPLALEVVEGALATARVEAEKARADVESRVDVIQCLNVGIDRAQAMLAETVPGTRLGYASPLRILRMQRAVNRSLALLRAMLT